MKKSKVVILFILGIVIGALAAVGVYFLTVGEVAWQEYIETKLIPNITLALSAISALCVAALPIIAKVETAVSKFKQATDDVNATVDNDKTVVQTIGEYSTKLDVLVTELKTLKTDVESIIAPVAKKVENIEKVVHIGFCNNEELVKKGYAHEIEKVGVEDESSEET